MPEIEPPSTVWRRLRDYDSDGLLVLDECLTIRLVNRAWCRMRKTDFIRLLAGEQGNPCHQNPLLPRNISLRHNLVEQVRRVLRGCGRLAEVDWVGRPPRSAA